MVLILTAFFFGGGVRQKEKNITTVVYQRSLATVKLQGFSSIRGKGTVHGNSYKTWYHNGEVDFKVLPELLGMLSKKVLLASDVRYVVAACSYPFCIKNRYGVFNGTSDWVTACSTRLPQDAWMSWFLHQEIPWKTA